MTGTVPAAAVRMNDWLVSKKPRAKGTVSCASQVSADEKMFAFFPVIGTLPVAAVRM